MNDDDYNDDDDNDYWAVHPWQENETTIKKINIDKMNDDDGDDDWRW